MIVPVLQLTFPPDVTPEERDLMAAALLDFGPLAVHEPGDLEWRVFFRTPAERDAALSSPIFERVSVGPLDLPDEDWARRSQADLRAITVGVLTIAPPWDVPERPDTTVIVIEPSTGFGTGHHATTRLCLRALQRVSLGGSTVLDVGTGSGILAIAAARLGAAAVTAIDNDPDALDAARANAARNHVPVEFSLADLSPTLPRADIVVANLTGAALRQHAPVLTGLALRVLIISGFLVEEADEVRAAFTGAGAQIDREDEEGWAAFTIRPTTPAGR